MKKVKYVEETDLLIKGASETIENKIKEQKVGFVSISLGSVLRNLLAGKVVRVGDAIIQAGEVTIRARQNFDATSSLTNFEIKNLLMFIHEIHKIKDGACVINIDEYK